MPQQQQHWCGAGHQQAHSLGTLSQGRTRRHGINARLGSKGEHHMQCDGEASAYVVAAARGQKKVQLHN